MKNGKTPTLISWCSSLRDSASRSLKREACEGGAAAGAGVDTPFVVTTLSVSIMLAIGNYVRFNADQYTYITRISTPHLNNFITPFLLIFGSPPKPKANYGYSQQKTPTNRAPAQLKATKLTNHSKQPTSPHPQRNSLINFATHDRRIDRLSYAKITNQPNRSTVTYNPQSSTNFQI